MRIKPALAKPFFDHKTQRKWAQISPDELPGDPFQYWAQEGVCGVFHPMPWPGIWMAHYGVLPDAWGHTKGPARAILKDFWDAEQPDLIIGWTEENNRAALAFSKRIGFTITGRMASGVIMQEWQSC